eukprot:Opistho-1_new@36989
MASKRAAPVNDAASRRTVAHTRISDTKGVEDTYDLGDILGKGSFGVVQVAIHKKSGEKWACKSLDKQKAGSSAVRQLEREVGILKRVNHKHVVQLREVLEAPKKIYLIMELCDGGDLLTCLEERKYLPEKDVAIIMKRLADVIAYLHDNEIVHRDLKLENILLSRADPNDPLNIKVSDFGLSYIKGKEGAMMSTMCGTPIYMAPEVIGKLGYSQQCDICPWESSCTFYCVALRRFTTRTRRCSTSGSTRATSASMGRCGPRFLVKPKTSYKECSKRTPHTDLRRRRLWTTCGFRIGTTPREHLLPRMCST